MSTGSDAPKLTMAEIKDSVRRLEAVQVLPDADGNYEFSPSHGLITRRPRRDSVGRAGDYEGRSLRLVRHLSGEVYVQMFVKGSGYVMAEFYSPNAGGKSPRTHKALLALFDAMVSDEEEGR